MCGRFTLIWTSGDGSPERSASTMRVTVAASYRPRYNVAPTDQHFVGHLQV